MVANCTGQNGVEISERVKTNAGSVFFQENNTAFGFYWFWFSQNASLTTYDNYTSTRLSFALIIERRTSGTDIASSDAGRTFGFPSG
ncbi:uncharacterized protein RSE6_13722 [Rhynchosporium secalis]|uniref:Uncharacterized protein n=1 Tax=Rhynchosporium secalis TaxID=38038 RepID=A0A1E1MTJ8_RHYSE|nr:uncharacterized protein RSE6_13722 [Rhynchosporium secalis]